MSLHTSSADITPNMPVRLAPDACPSCGQNIPADRLEELTGRIAARDRDQALALTTRLNDEFRTAKAAADAKATAELERVQRESILREQRAVQDANAAANARFAQTLAEQQTQASAVQAALQVQLDASATAQQHAEQQRLQLNATLEETRRTNTEHLAQVQAEATARETQLRENLGAEIERAVAERLTTTTTAHKAAEQALQDQLAQARTTTSVLEQQHAALRGQLTELCAAKDAEITTIKTTAAAQAARARQEGIDQAAANYAPVLKEKDTAVTAAQTAAEDAKLELRNVKQELQKELTSQLESQREVLEKAQDVALSAERAKAFAENEKLRATIAQVTRDLEKKTNEELGEGAELDLYEELRLEFPEDNITRIPKGAAGPDINHEIIHAGKVCGTIIYDSKNHKQWRNEHASKLHKDQLTAKADHAILSTHMFPKGTKQLVTSEGVLLANPARVVALACILRDHVVRLHTLRVSSIEREAKTAKLYDFITSDRYTKLTGRIDEKTAQLLTEQEKEIKYHERVWKQQGESYRAIQKARADLDTELLLIIGAEDDTTPDEDEITDEPADDDVNFSNEFLK